MRVGKWHGLRTSSESSNPSNRASSDSASARHSQNNPIHTPQIATSSVTIGAAPAPTAQRLQSRHADSSTLITIVLETLQTYQQSKKNLQPPQKVSRIPWLLVAERLQMNPAMAHLVPSAPKKRLGDVNRPNENIRKQYHRLVQTALRNRLNISNSTKRVQAYTHLAQIYKILGRDDVTRSLILQLHATTKRR